MALLRTKKTLQSWWLEQGPDSQHPSLMTVPQLKQISPTSNYTSRNTSKIIQVHMCHGPFLGYKRQKSHTDLLLAKFAKLSENLWFLILFIHCLVLFLGLPSLLSPSTHFRRNTHDKTNSSHFAPSVVVSTSNRRQWDDLRPNIVAWNPNPPALYLPREPAGRLRSGCSPWFQSDKDLEGPKSVLKRPKKTFQRRMSGLVDKSCAPCPP